MGPVTLKVDPDVLIAKSGELESKKNQIRDLLEDAKNKVNTLPSDWEGSASQALQARFKQTYDDMEKILAIVQEHADDLKTVGEDFRNTAQAIESEIEGLPIEGVQ